LISPRSDDLLVDVRHVTYTHWNQSEPTLRDLSFRLCRGTLNILVGPSGSGKSTLCDLFNGVIPHLHGGKLEGEVWVDGLKTADAEVKLLSQRVGRVFQDPEIMFAMLHVDDEIAFGPENLRRSPAEIRAVVEELLGQTELAGRRHSLVWNLSGGQIQKLGLATVLAMRPNMIVLDEPTSNLDPGATRSVHQLVRALRDSGITVLLVTRELDELLAEVDQLLVLDRGRLVAAGPPRQVLAEHGRQMVEALGVWLPETSEIGVELRASGLALERPVPITVAETVDLLAEEGLLGERLPAHTGAPASSERAPEPGDVLIHAAGLRYAYPGGTEALRGVSFDIRRGEWVMIVGRNGAGKSTLARLLVGLSQAAEAQLTLFGRDARRWKVHDLANHIALVFQNPEHQFLTDSVADEIGYSLLARGISDPALKAERTDRLLEQLGLTAVRACHPFALSAGLKRRLGVATMLVGEPEVLLVDEPTYGQDRAMTHALMARMQQIRDQGVAVVMITHDMRLVQEYAQRVLVMSDGLVQYDGPADGLFARQDVLERANLRPTMLHELLAALAERGIAVEGPIRRTADLIDLLRAAWLGRAEAAHG
jgi:energy-coupling factor transport system ATP-binding protein